MNAKRTAGFWGIIAGSSVLLCLLVLGQTIALIDYELTVSMGLQEPEAVVGALGVAMNKGFGAGDTVIYVPLLVVGLVGLWRRRMFGVIALAGSFAITAYWPVVVLSFLALASDVPDFRFDAYAAYTVILAPIIVYGVWGLWYLGARNRDLVR